MNPQTRIANLIGAITIENETLKATIDEQRRQHDEAQAKCRLPANDSPGRQDDPIDPPRE